MNNIKFDIKSKTPLIIQILFCLVILLVPLLVMYRNGIDDMRPYLGYLGRTAFIIFVFYVNYLYLIDKFLFKKQFVGYLVTNLFLVVSIILSQDMLMGLFSGPPPLRMRQLEKVNMPPHELKILGDAVVFVLAIGMSVAMKVTKQWYQDSINLETVKATQLEADLRNLRSQLNPHFLFNTLNNIYSLTAIDKSRAQDAIQRLSNLLRYVLYENSEKFVSIEKELEFTRNYIDLMKLRLSSDVKLDVMIRSDHSTKEIASLIFITLVENAFKHGIHNGKGSFINIKIFVDDEKGVLCTVENSRGDKSDPLETKNSGIGLANLNKRLELLYPHRYQFEVKQSDSLFTAILCIEFDNDKNN